MKPAEVITSLYTDRIPMGIIAKSPIKTSEMSDEAKKVAMKNFLPRESKMPNQEQMTKMASADAHVARAMSESEDIKRDTINWQQVIEDNKAKKASDPNRGLNGIRRAHMDAQPNSGMGMSADTAKKILQDQKRNYLLGGSLQTHDAVMSEFSRDDLRQKRRDKLTSTTREYTESGVVRANDRDPITGARKGYNNISEIPATQAPVPNFQRLKTQASPQEIEQKNENVLRAMELLKAHNKQKIHSMTGHKDIWHEDALDQIDQRIKSSVQSLRSQKKAEIEDHLKIADVKPQDVATTLKDYFKSKETRLDSLTNEIKEFNQQRSSAIKNTRSIKTSLDQPSLPVHSANQYSRTMDRLMENLPEHLKEKYAKKSSR